MTPGSRVFVTMWGPRKYQGARGTVTKAGVKNLTVKLDGDEPLELKGNRAMFHSLTIHTDEKG